MALELPAAHELLVQSIREQRLLVFTYRGLRRVVEPHAYGRNAKGEAVLLAYQNDGESASKPLPGWRTFAAAHIESLSLSDTAFKHARDGYSPNELRLAPLWAEVAAVTTVE